jgi:tripartite-type tricarboxylate transporter receptor subunit TctC
MTIRLVAAACFALVLAALSGTDARAQSSRTIRLIVAMPAGASTDSVARLMAEHIGKAQGVTVVVENRPGASGMLGTELASRAAPDGNTLLMTANTYLIDAQTRKANYHPVTAFDPICLLVDTPAVFTVNSDSPYKTLSELLDAARAKPGTVSMGSVGPGSTFQFGFLNFTRAANVDMTFVPFAGSGPAVTALLGNHITSAFSGIAAAGPQVRANKLRALAVATPKRIEALPDVPTFDELGFKNVSVDVWFGVVAPAGTPKEILAQLNTWFTQAYNAPEVKAKFAAQQLYPVGTCGDDFGAVIRKAYDEYGRMISQAGLKKE